MTSPTSPNPFSAIELQKLLGLTTMTQVAKLALKAGNTVDDLLSAGAQAQYTRQGVYQAVRNAGHRTRKVRSDKGLTIRNRIQKLIDQARDLEAKLAQQDDGGSDGK